MKLFTQACKYGAKAFATATALVGASAFAAGPDMSALTGAVDFGTVTAAILAIAAVYAVVYVARNGAGQVLSMLRTGR